MSDLQLFRVAKGKAAEIEGKSAALEKGLQRFFEANLEALFGVRFVATEHPTGKAHKGRIDTLGLDENGFPVIIEYKRKIDEVVVTQGLYYLDWLADHHGDFELLVLARYNRKTADEIKWSSPRLICVAADYTKYDEHAVRQIPRNIDLVRYKQFSSDLLLIELVNSTSVVAEAKEQEAKQGAPATPRARGIKKKLGSTSPALKKLFKEIADHIQGLGDDVSVRKLQLYWAFSRLKNIACLEVQRRKLLLHLAVDPSLVKLEKGFTRDMRGVGHFGTGDLLVTIGDESDFERAKPLILRAYEGR